MEAFHTFSVAAFSLKGVIKGDSNELDIWCWR